jgi:hypothetical protein
MSRFPKYFRNSPSLCPGLTRSGYVDTLRIRPRGNREPC